jgi:hypothetical protein
MTLCSKLGPLCFLGCVSIRIFALLLHVTVTVNVNRKPSLVTVLSFVRQISVTDLQQVDEDMKGNRWYVPICMFRMDCINNFKFILIAHNLTAGNHAN